MVFFMFIRYILVILALAVVGCAKPPSNPYRDQIVSNNTWYPITFGKEQAVYFYAPFQTTYSSDGLITTLIAQSKGRKSNKELPSRWEINCFDRTVKIYGLDANGSWKVFKDWEQVAKNTTGESTVTNLCLKSANGRDELQFLSTEYNLASEKYETYFWNPNQNLSEANSSTRVFQISMLKFPNAGWSNFYCSVNCVNRHYATSTDPKSKDLKWKDTPSDSAVGLLLIKACGSSNNMSEVRNQHIPNTAGSSKNPLNTRSIDIPKTNQPVDAGPPVYRNVQVYVESTPNGATVKDTKTGQTAGVTPFVKNFTFDISKLKTDRCTTIDGLSFEWVSGAKLKTTNPFKLCMYADDKFLVSIQRPKSPGLQMDIDYQVKLQQLQIQQEALAAQQRQAIAAEQQARAQEAQAASEAEQANSAQNALLLQMFQGGSMIKKSPTRMPINCSQTVLGDYSCY